MFRFAPSPTGDMHIGNLRVALFNFIVSSQKNEKFIIRIEDTDKVRNIEGKDREILEILALFDIKYQNVSYQSANIKFHRQLATQLLSDGNAFICFCSDELLDEKREEAKKQKKAYKYDGTCEGLSDRAVMENEESSFTVRIKKPLEDLTFFDKIKGSVSFGAKEIDSFVILRKDKTPTYNYACAVDDMLSNIGFVIRGEDHLSNTPKQEHIRKLFKYDEKMEFAHLPIILNIEGKKMSKRDDASSVKWLLEQGFLPQAITNYLILHGNKTPKKIFSLDEALDWFDIEKISKNPAKFDINQLRDLNNAHINLMDSLKLSTLIGYSSADIGELAKLYTEEASTINELKPKIDKVFRAKVSDDENVAKLRSVMSDTPYFEEFNEFKKYLMVNSGLKGKNFFQPLRFLLTGANSGPKLQDVYPLIKNYLTEIIK